MRAVGGGVVAPSGARAPGVGGATAPPLRGPFAGSPVASTRVFRSKRLPPAGEKGSARAPRATPSLPHPSSSRVQGVHGSSIHVSPHAMGTHAMYTCQAHVAIWFLAWGRAGLRPKLRLNAIRQMRGDGTYELQASHVRGKHVKWVRCSEARRTHKHVYPQCRPLERSPAAGPVSSWFIPVPSSSQHPSSLLADQRLRSVAIWPRSGSAPLVNIFEPTGHPLTPPGGLGINLSGLTQIRMNSGV